MTIADALAIKIDWHLDTGKVSIPGRSIGVQELQPNFQSLVEAEGDEFALAEVSKGDSRPFDIALFNEGQALDIELKTLAFGYKEFETGILNRLNADDGTDFVKIVRDGQTRYRIPVKVSAAKAQAILQKYADPSGTFVDTIGEIQLTADYVAAQEAEIGGGPSSLNIPANDTQILEVELPLDMENGEVKQFTLSARVSHAEGNSLATYDYDNDVAGVDHFRNVQTDSTFANFTASKQNDTFTVSNGAVSDPVKEFEQILRQYVAREVWIDRLTWGNVEGTDNGVKISCEVVTESFQHPELDLPETIWVADIALPRLSWDRYGHNGIGNDRKWDIVTGGSGEIFSDSCEILLVTSGATQLGVSIPPDYYTEVQMSQAINTAAGNFYIMGPSSSNTGASSALRNRFQLVFPTQPAADSVRIRLDSDDTRTADYAIREYAVPQASEIVLEASIAGQQTEEEEDTIAGRLSTSSFVFRLRRDLLPDVTVQGGSGGS